MRRTVVALVLCLLFVSPVLSQKAIKSIQGNDGKRWAICIGINDYADKRIIDLSTARNDAKQLSQVLKEYGQFDEVILMTDNLDVNSDNYPKKNSVDQKMAALKGAVKPKDFVLFFFSGHGISNAAGEGFLILANSYRENLNGTSVRVKDVVKWMGDMGVQKSMLLIDACREQFLEGNDLKQNGVPLEDFSQERVGAVFYAATAGSFGYSGGSTGVFTQFIIDGLKGNADMGKTGGNGDKWVSFSELASYLNHGIGQWASSKGKNQKPQIKVYANQVERILVASTEPLASSASGGAAIALRSDYQTLKGGSILSMLTKWGFFDAKVNPKRSFSNKYESRTISGDPVVVDAATGLMWHQAGSDKPIEMAQAVKWIEVLNQKGYAGYKDWRLPTLEEAASLIESSQKGNGLYIDPLFSSEQKNIWTGDLSASDTAWVVFFNQGMVNRDYFSNYFYIRPVRSSK